VKHVTRAIGIGVIGLGVMGRAYVEVLQELTEAKVVGVAEINQERLEATCAEFSLEGYADYQSLQERDDIEAVAICTPEALHLEPARRAADKGFDLLIEKPLAQSSAMADEIVTISERAGIKLMVGHILRFDPRYALAYESIRRGDVGEIIHVYTRRSGLASEGRYFGGRVSLAMCFGVHDIDVIHWFTGSRIVRVYAESARKVLTDLNVDDTILCLLKLEDGTVCNVELCWALPDAANPSTQDVALELVGTQGVIKIEGQRQGLEVATANGVSYPDTLFGPKVNGSVLGVLKHELAHFLVCIRNNQAPRVEARAAVEAIRVAEAIDRSLAEGRPVNLAAPREV
jgi:UDP-N-acetylglucosamine 3-dehydrogenase